MRSPSRVAATAPITTSVGLDRKTFEQWQDHLRTGAPLPADFDRKNLVPPFERRDREADMAHAYHHFARTLAKGSA